MVIRLQTVQRFSDGGRLSLDYVTRFFYRRIVTMDWFLSSIPDWCYWSFLNVNNIAEAFLLAKSKEYTGRMAMATLLHTFHHDGQISPDWWGWEVHAHPLSLYCIYHQLQKCTLMEGRYSLPILLYPYMYSVVTSISNTREKIHAESPVSLIRLNTQITHGWGVIYMLTTLVRKYSPSHQCHWYLRRHMGWGITHRCHQCHWYQWRHMGWEIIYMLTSAGEELLTAVTSVTDSSEDT